MSKVETEKALLTTAMLKICEGRDVKVVIPTLLETLERLATWVLDESKDKKELDHYLDAHTSLPGPIGNQFDKLFHGIRKTTTTGFLNVDLVVKLTGLSRKAVNNKCWEAWLNGDLRKDIHRWGYYGLEPGHDYIYSWEEGYKPKPKPVLPEGPRKVSYRVKPL